MSPRAERIETEVPVKERGGFFIRLDTPDAFVPDKFDQLVEELMCPWKDFGAVDLKYIVRGETMLVFSAGVLHDTADEQFRRRGCWDGDLRSAGEIILRFEDEHIVRRLCGSSLSLKGQLPTAQSADYRDSVLKEKLSPHFEVGERL